MNLADVKVQVERRQALTRRLKELLVDRLDLAVDPVYISAAARFGVSEADDLFPTATVVANVRGSFSQ